MGNTFSRENRYVVFKTSDIDSYLSAKESDDLSRLIHVVLGGRVREGKGPLNGVFVEEDWPEFDPTWRAIEARVNGVQQVPDGSAIQTAARILNIDLIRQCVALQAKVAEMEQQDPVAWMSSRNGFICKENKNPDYNVPLYGLPGTRPAPIVPEKIKRVESGFKGMFLREAQAYKKGWNECRAEMLSATAKLEKK